KNIFILLILISALSCNKDIKQIELKKNVDSQTFAEINKARITHLIWDVEADFERKILKGSAAYEIENNESTEIILDIDGLKIDSVILDNQEKTQFTIGDKDVVKGNPLAIKIIAESKKITVYYETRTDSGALQWLSPEQTFDKTHPFLLTQGQAILTRSYIPVQDTPSLRITYEATVKVPKELIALMSAKTP